jgi:mannan endo-1,4-beta-mannosidase
MRDILAWLRAMPGQVTRLGQQATTNAIERPTATGVFVILTAGVAASVIVIAAPAQPGGARRISSNLAASAATPTLTRSAHPVRAVLPPTPLSYMGVYEPRAPNADVPVTEFGHLVGRKPDIALYYSGWLQSFALTFADDASTAGATPLVQIDPGGVSLTAIARGKYDFYLRTYADEVALYKRPVIIGFGHEMNAPWYSWGYGKASPSSFVLAWRHIVRVFRSQNADNVTWLWTISRASTVTGIIRDWWPGASYVTWIGVDGYYVSPNSTFKSVFAQTIAAVRKITEDPVLLSETAVGPRAGQARGIRNLFAGIRRGRYLGLVWFDIAQNSGVYHQDWRLEGRKAAVKAFRAQISKWRLYRSKRLLCRVSYPTVCRRASTHAIVVAP